MADLPQSSDWTQGVYQLETSDPVLGGPEGVSNLQARQLGNRTSWLKARLDDIAAKVQQASESVAGIVRLATQALVKQGTDDRTAVTPKKLAAMFPFRGIAVYSVPGVHTWAVPSGVTKAWVVIIGGGGGGGRLQLAPGPSGGSGAGVARKLVDLTGIKSVIVTVGLGGVRGLVDGAEGTNGGTTSFGTIFWATGGIGGMLDGKARPGGIGLNGDENISLGFGCLPLNAVNNGGLLGGGGGGGCSSYAGIGDAKARTPGHGGGGRTGGPAADGADGHVRILW
ncbi:glycine-rich domain-containing protein [Pseudomonas prosekii]|uniref:glycine-rich domain-containing protein n=1 Tax=Pseudomonas prosekii TaxID=1148509 RepID=UPI00387AA0B5